MKLQIKELHTALTFLRDIIPSKPHIQTFAYCHMSVSDGKLLLRGINDGKYAEIVVTVVDTNKFENTLVPMDKLYPFVSEAKKIADELVLFSDGITLTLYIGGDMSDESKIKLIDESEFPDRPKFNGSVLEMEIDSSSFLEGVELSSLTGNQFVMTQSLHIFTENNKLIFEATNGFSGGKVAISECNETLDIAVGADFNRIVSKAARMFPGKWMIKVTKRHLIVDIDNGECIIAYSLVNEKYLDMSRMYSNIGTTTFSVNREELLSNVNIINALSDSAILNFTVDNNILTVETEKSADNIDSRKYSVEINDTENSMTKLQLKELTKIVAMLDGDTVWFQYSPRTPILVFDSNTAKKFFIIAQQ